MKVGDLVKAIYSDLDLPDSSLGLVVNHVPADPLAVRVLAPNGKYYIFYEWALEVISEAR